MCNTQKINIFSNNSRKAVVGSKAALEQGKEMTLGSNLNSQQQMKRTRNGN